MSVITVYPGDLITLDPSSQKVLQFDWDDWLASAAGISSNTFTITTVKQNGGTILTKDNESIVSGNRQVQLRVLATTATLGDKYTLASKIVTNESPAQTEERSIKITIGNR